MSSNNTYQLFFDLDKYLVFCLDPISSIQSKEEFKEKFTNEKIVIIDQHLLLNKLKKDNKKFYIIINPEKNILQCATGIIQPSLKFLKRYIFQICFGKLK
jgi:hypothetical protein